MLCCEASVNDNDGGRIYLQGDEVFKDLNALVVLWVLLDVRVCKECLQRMKFGQLFKHSHLKFCCKQQRTDFHSMTKATAAPL